MAGGGNKKRFQYCTDSSGLTLYLRALQGHSGRNVIDPSLQDNVMIPDTLFQEVTDHHNQKDGFQGSTKIGPVLEVTTSCLYGKQGVEIRIWSLSKDNTHSWVRISHGSNKFVMDSNAEVPEDQPEEQALRLKVKDFACRSKAKAKPQRRELADYSPSIIPMNERNWIDIEPGNHSLSAFEVSKKVIHLLRHSQQVQR